MKNYLLLQPDEDGNPVSFLEPREVENIKQLMEDYSIDTWRENFKETNPQYWDEGEAMLIEYEIKVPKAVKVVEEYEL